jgi:hypothetical protein
MFEPSWHHVYVRAESRFFYHLHPCSCSSLSDTMFMFERSREPFWHHVYVRAESRTLFVRQAESRTLRYLFTFERSREPCATLLLVYARAKSRTLRYFTPCLCSSGVENLFIRQAESRTLFQIVTLRTTSYLNNECHFYILKVLLIYPSSDRLRLAFLLCSIFW